MNPKIMVVDDEPGVIAIMKSYFEILTENGFMKECGD